MNARIEYESNRFEIYIWAKNLFDETYATTYVDFQASGGGLWGRPGPLRTFGIALRYYL